jgi:hypothetical protein
MTSSARTAATARSAAVADLFDALEGLLITYQALPSDERARRWSGDADRITGEVARQLGAARARLASTFDPALREEGAPVQVRSGPAT